MNAGHSFAPKIISLMQDMLTPQRIFLRTIKVAIALMIFLCMVFYRYLG
jgi:hypothetical protein